MNKRIGIAVLLALVLLASPAVAQDRVDLIVLLDSSQSMFQYYNQVVDFVLSGTVREYMRFGDAFHLLSFSDSTQVEIAQVLRTEQDLKSVIARLYLLYPLGKNTDLVTALKNVYQYVSDLPESSAKHIVLITDGMHSPAPGTSYANFDAAQIKAEMEKAATRIRQRGWTMRIVRVPFNGSSGSGASASGTAQDAASGTGPSEAAPTSPGSGDYLSDVAAAVGTSVSDFNPSDGSSSIDDTVDLPRISFPADLGTRDYAFSISVEIDNRASRPVSLELTKLLLADGTDVLVEKAFAQIESGKSSKLSLKVLLPESMPQGPTVLTLEPRFADSMRVSPARSTVRLELKKAPLAAFFRSSAKFALFLVILAIACGAVIVSALYVHRIHKKAEGPIVDALIDSSTKPSAKPSSRQSAAMTAAGQHRSPYATGTAEPVEGHRDRAAILAAASARPSEHREDLLSSAASGAHRDSAVSSALLGSASSQHRDAAEASALLGSWAKPPAKQALAGSRGTLDAGRISKATPVHYEPSIARSGSARLVMHVRDQNPNIGKRNIHTLHAGGRKSFGGGSSDFWVFLLPVPARVAHLYFDGLEATLVPSRPEFFPDYEGAIESCMGREIRMVTAKGKELFIRFDRYEAPVDRLNKLLHCIEAPGLVQLSSVAPAGDAAVD
jgi:hypothetical protein